MKISVRICLLISAMVVSLRADEIFPTPSILKDNVAFWKKIYTEVGLTEGLIHDREYPLVIYKKIDIGKRSGSSRRRFIRAEKNGVEAVLAELTGKKAEQWSSEAKRVAALFEAHAPENALRGAAHRIRFQQGQKQRFFQGLQRSGAYMDTIRAILTAYDVPLRLTHLPHVESSFNPYAYSKVGAAGLWQFMRSTGKMYLNIDYLVDERRDPILSTVAAAKLLSYNYRKLDSWPLAITAYNHGLNGMKRAVAATGSKDIGVIVQKHSSRSFRFASKNFYSCFLAASEIAMNAEDYFPVIDYAPRLVYNDIALSHYIRPDHLAGALGIGEDLLMELNPAIRPVVFHQKKLIPKGTVVHIPVAISARVATGKISSLPDSVKLAEPPRPQYYQVRRGDNLYGIARRLGVSARDIALENNISRMNRIYAGQILRIPGQASAKPAPAVAAAKTEPKPRQAATEAAVDTPDVKVAAVAQKKTKAESPPPPKSAAPADTTPVQPPPLKQPASAEAPADTPATIEALSDTMQDLIMEEADATEPDRPPRDSYARGVFDADVYNLETTITAIGNTVTIRVSVNETIGHYADWLGIPTWQIRRANRMGRRSGIRMGQRLTIPADEQQLERFIQRRLEYHMALEEDFYSQFKVTGLKPMTIERGENLWSISNEEGLPLWLIKKFNMDVDLGRLTPGAELHLPLVEEKTAEDLAQEAAPWGGVPVYRKNGARIFNSPLRVVP
jgi:membrane-bound lytic murein transglycosylase D